MKTIFVDFDDTLCLHNTRAALDEFIFADVPTACQHFFGKSELNRALYQYLVQQQKQGDRIILLSMSCSKMLAVKQNWLAHFCPDLKFDDIIGVSLDFTKAETMLAYAKIHGLQPSELLLIDDKSKERWAAEAEGILTTSPQLIMNRLDTL